MTTIAYKDGVLAADTRAYSGTSLPIGAKRSKVRQLADGTLIAASSPEPGWTEAFMDWIEAGSDPDAKPDFKDGGITGLVIDRAGAVFYYTVDLMPSGPIDAEYIAIGSGDKYALGALALGCTAQAAVEVAAQFDPWTGGTVQIYTHLDTKEAI